ncbi:MAG TPA: TonB-dependent receptor [Saprospiraceae bacterium]|nr:TonB-dependent receptor [Saprospiraceae bacterium]HMQ83778.1 TonB-dependent receptor [Saprospiraceae bacterium]
MLKYVLPVAMLLLFAVATQAQCLVHGRVSGEHGETLTGANVVLIETQQGTASDKNGQFALQEVLPGIYTLSVTYIGYEQETLQLEVQSGIQHLSVDVKLKSQSFQMQGVVVKSTRAGAKTPMTYVNLSDEEIQRNNLGQDVPFLLRWTPSVIVNSDAGTGIGYTGIRIRGTDPTRINVTINGIPLNDAESQGVFWVDLPDFASSTSDIQIQRGVGTSTNGAGAFGASINLNTSDLKPEPYAELNTSIGSFNTFKGNLVFGTGLLNKHFSVDGRLSRITSDGYIDRASAELNSFYLSVARTGERSMLRFNVFSGHEVTYQAWYGVPKAYLDDEVLRRFNPSGTEKEGTPHDDEVDNYRQMHYQLLYNTHFSPLWNLNLALHYTKGKGYFEQYKADQDLADYGLETMLFDTIPLPLTDLIRRRWLDNDFYGGVYALHYEHPSGRMDFTLGGGVHIYKGRHFGEIIWAEFASNSEKDDRYYDNDALKKDANVYAKLNYDLGKGLNAYVDLQLRQVNYNFIGLNAQGQVTDQQANLLFFNPKAGLFYAWNEKNKLYTSFAVGQREPNRDDYVDSSPDSRPLPERLYNTELGYEHSLEKGFLGLNAYWMDYRNQLVLTGEVNDVGAYTRVNIDKSYRLGLEGMAAWQLSNALHLEANATISRNKVRFFTEFVDVYDADFNWLEQQAIERRNTDLSFSPNIMASGILSYTLGQKSTNQSLTFSVLSKYIGKQYIDNSSDEANVLDPYFFTDFRAVWILKNKWFKELGLTFWVQNVLDAQYESNAWSYRYVYDGATALDQGFFPQAGRNYLLGIRIGL